MRHLCKPFLIITFLSISLLASSQMILQYNTNMIDGTTIQLPLFGIVDVTVDWGDGNIDTINSPGTVYHTYSNEGIFQIEVSGYLTIFGTEDWSINSLSLTNVINFGNIGLNSLFYAFDYSFNLQTVPSVLPATITDLTGCFANNTQEYFTNINLWDVSNVILMEELFNGSNNFTQNISNWNVSSVTNMRRMFRSIDTITTDISSWDVSNVTDMSGMFSTVEFFDTDISNWDVSNVTNMSSMFANSTSFNQDIGSWDVSNVTNMASMFSNATSFNQDIGSWDVLNVVDMSFMFKNAIAFNQGIGNWNMINVKYMTHMFNNSISFNRDISNWEVSNVIDMEQLFNNATNFNQDISNWDVSSVVNMFGMFWHASIFNQYIGDWDVSNVNNMDAMFSDATYFNQDIGGWDVSNVDWMQQMFYKAQSFNQDISDWCVEQIPIQPANFSYYCPLINEYHPHWGEICTTSIKLLTENVTSLIFTNPVINYVHIIIDSHIRKVFQNNVLINIIDINGSVVFSHSVDLNQPTVIINVEKLQSGIYSLTLSDNQNIIIEKFIKLNNF